MRKRVDRVTKWGLRKQVSRLEDEVLDRERKIEELLKSIQGLERVVITYRAALASAKSDLEAAPDGRVGQ